LAGPAKNERLRNAALRIIREKRVEKGLPAEKKGDRFAEAVMAAMKRAREEALKQAEEVRQKLLQTKNEMEGLRGPLRKEFDRVCKVPAGGESSGDSAEEGITRGQLSKILMRRCYRKRKDQFHLLPPVEAYRGNRSPLGKPGVFNYTQALVKCDRNVVSLLVKEAFEAIDDQPTMSFEQFVSACSDLEKRSSTLNTEEVEEGAWGDLSGGADSEGSKTPRSLSMPGFLSGMSSQSSFRMSFQSSFSSGDGMSRSGSPKSPMSLLSSFSLRRSRSIDASVDG